MTTSSKVCVDASLVINLLMPDEYSKSVQSMWRSWKTAGVTPFGPPLLYSEATSVLRSAVFRRRISAKEGDQVFDELWKLDIAVYSGQDLHLLAWELAKRYNHPKTYDLNYVAAAQIEGCDLWTGDRRLVNSVGLPWVRWIGDHAQVDIVDERS